MYVHWREREHEEVDKMVEENLRVVDTLKQCILWKLFGCSLMRAQPRLLNHLVEYQNPDVEGFMIEGQSLTPTIEDLLFLTSMYRSGESVNLDTFPPKPYHIANYIDTYCEAGIEKVGSQVSIRSNSITTLYSKTLLVDSPIQTSPEDTN